MPRADDIHRSSGGGADDSAWGSTEWPDGWNVRHVAETGSTNADLLRLYSQGAAGPRTALVADHQTAGRGRRDRRWDAPPGENLLVSFLFVGVPAAPGRLVQRIGLAIVLAVETIVGDRAVVELKWPNDVLLGGRKVAGILAERSDDAIVVGAGVNVGWAPGDAARIETVAPGGPPHRATVLAAVLAAHESLPADDGLLALYRSRLATLGASVRAHLPDGRVLDGEAIDIDDSGALVVRDGRGARHVLHAADIVHLRPR